MPREQINTLPLQAKIGQIIATDDGDVQFTDVEFTDGTPEASSDVINTDATVHVTWLRQGDVQIAFEAHESYLRCALASMNGDRIGHTFMYTPPLTRGEINKMINTLRRARDAAYGRDE